jgi:hypothetical protein
MNHPGKIRSLAATARLANVPSVVSNVALGVLLAMRPLDGDGVLCSGVAALAGICLYLYGGFANDWADHKWDASNRPERALPRGLFAPSVYLACAVFLAVAGLAAAAFLGANALASAAAIAACVAIYTWLHKKSAWSIVPMGLCRALLPLLGWAAIGNTAALPAVIAGGAALWFHVAGISIMAREESLARTTPGVRGWHRAFFAVPMLVAFMECRYGLALPALTCLPGLLPYSLWTAFHVFSRSKLPARISGLLAGIPWVDAMLLFPIHLAGVAAAGTACLWLPPLAFVCGKALQRLAPAT